MAKAPLKVVDYTEILRLLVTTPTAAFEVVDAACFWTVTLPAYHMTCDVLKSEAFESEPSLAELYDRNLVKQLEGIVLPQQAQRQE